MSDHVPSTFTALGLPEFVQKALDAVGYETPSPIQAKTIPYMLDGDDVLGQAQTGTGKTAAFALPLVANIDIKTKTPQALILAPTRELAIQVAEALQTYAQFRPGFHVAPIYGGQNYTTQIKALKRGVHVVVGTPGRVMDHMRKGTLKLNDIKALVLDEADEMLRMGFIDDVEWILEKTPGDQQIALFSATMPKEIKHITKRYLKNPKEVTIAVKTQTAANIRQRVWMVSGLHKLDALTRILETEPFDGAIIFVRTKIATEELADKLQARGYAAAALNGDMQQKARAQTVDNLKNARIDIVIATDVAARGLDVERISHVINYDIPYDTEAYVHRIGRTGRAGRSGEAILFAAPREQRMLRSIERATKQPIEPMRLPSTKDVNSVRIERFKSRITDTLGQGGDLTIFRDLIESFHSEHNIPIEEIAAALAKMAQGNEPLLLKDLPKVKQKEKRKDKFDNNDKFKGGDRAPRDRKERKPRKREADSSVDMDLFKVDAGYEHGILPKHVVGAIANEAEIDSQFIGDIDIRDECTYVELPAGMPKEVQTHLKKARILSRPMKLQQVDSKPPKPAKGGDTPVKKRLTGERKPRKRPRS